MTPQEKIVIAQQHIDYLLSKTKEDLSPKVADTIDTYINSGVMELKNFIEKIIRQEN